MMRGQLVAVCQLVAGTRRGETSACALRLFQLVLSRRRIEGVEAIYQR